MQRGTIAALRQRVRDLESQLESAMELTPEPAVQDLLAAIRRAAAAGDAKAAKAFAIAYAQLQDPDQNDDRGGATMIGFVAASEPDDLYADLDNLNRKGHRR